MRSVLGKLLYILVPVTMFLLGIGFIFEAGKELEANIPAYKQLNKLSFQYEWREMLAAFGHPLAIFLLQLVTIITASQVCAYLFKKIGQPAVMGEIIAGILLGPSLLGAVFPHFSAFVFPPSSLDNLHILSQVGLMLFMFVIGMELDPALVKKKAGAAMVISNASIIAPFGLGIALSYFLYKQYTLPGIPFYAFALFIGIAMSITAFPILARIISERGQTNSRLGILALTSAAAGDIAGWCLLAVVIAIVKAGSLGMAVYTLIATLVYIGFMLGILRPMMSRLTTIMGKDKFMKRSVLALVFVVMLLSAYCCEVIGIHALFGAFIAGVVMPSEWNYRKVIIDKIEDMSMVLLLPLFFVFTGLRTEFGLLNDATLWATCGLIILTAILGKLGGSAMAARLSGESLHDSLAIGILMNTRGLMELIILNIGYDLGILSAQMFTMMVLMALVTTFMATPMLNLLDKRFKT
ncbi:MAG: hypothetical protein BGO69_18060 [Bacteroidetes bacterium 46-16]|nr:MAG: hypothetical protein BGO69_18060 [Bacteroidetes bacterium 46-16]